MKIRSEAAIAGDAAAVAEQCAAGHRAFGIASKHADTLAALGKLRRQRAEQAALPDAAAAGQGDDGRSSPSEAFSKRGRISSVHLPRRPPASIVATAQRDSLVRARRIEEIVDVVGDCDVSMPIDLAATSARGSTGIRQSFRSMRPHQNIRRRPFP